MNRRYIARLNSNGTLDTTFNSPLTGTGYLYVAEILPDGKILIGGEFTQGTFQNFARLNDDGSIDSTFNVVGTGQLRGTNSQVHALKVMTDGRILIGGAFTQYNEINKRFLRLLLLPELLTAKLEQLNYKAIKFLLEVSSLDLPVMQTKIRLFACLKMEITIPLLILLETVQLADPLYSTSNS